MPDTVGAGAVLGIVTLSNINMNMWLPRTQNGPFAPVTEIQGTVTRTS